MSRIVQVGEAVGGFPMFGYAPPEPLVPSGFTISEATRGGLLYECERPECHWQLTPASGVHLTELATLAVEHVREAHRG